ncbi:MAG: DUF6531 domain-containing protein [Opitutaceae bacterium]
MTRRLRLLALVSLVVAPAAPAQDVGPPTQLDPVTVTGIAGDVPFPEFGAPFDGFDFRNSNNYFVYQPTPRDPDKRGVPDCDEGTERPVDIVNGNKILIETDFVLPGEFPLRLVRTHNRLWRGVGIFGIEWSSSFDAKLSFGYGSRQCYFEPGDGGRTCEYATSPLTEIFAWRPDGGGLTFKWNVTRSRWEDAKADSVSWIEQEPDGVWVLHHDGSTVERYTATGEVLSIANLHGVGWTFEYDAVTSLLKSVVHSSGRKVELTWGANGKVSAIRDPAGNIYTYTYVKVWTDPSNYYEIIDTVTYPGSPSVTRKYTLGGVLFGIVNVGGIQVNGVQYSNYTYYSDGRVKTSGLVNGIESSSLVYGSNYTEVTNALGVKSRYNLTDANGTKQITSIERSGITNCPV